MYRRLQWVIFAAALIGLPSTSSAIEYHLLTESDPGGLDNFNYFSFDSLGAFQSGTASSSTFLSSLAPAVSAGGFDYDGTTYHLITESDPGGLNNLNYFTFNSLGAFQSGTPSSSTFLSPLAAGVSVAGFAFDGSTYHLLTESDPGGANNLNYFTYNSLGAFQSGTPSTSTSLFSLAPAVSVAGFDFDGATYHLLTESDPGGLNNFNYYTFNSLGAFQSGTASSSTFLSSLAPAVSAGGFAVTTSVPVPSTLPLFGASFLALIALERSLKKRVLS